MWFSRFLQPQEMVGSELMLNRLLMTFQPYVEGRFNIHNLEISMSGSLERSEVWQRWACIPTAAPPPTPSSGGSWASSPALPSTCLSWLVDSVGSRLCLLVFSNSQPKALWPACVNRTSLSPWREPDSLTVPFPRFPVVITECSAGKSLNMP